MRKGQGSLEYLLILAAILAIAVVVVVVANSLLSSPEEQTRIGEDKYACSLQGIELVGYTTPGTVTAVKYGGVNCIGVDTTLVASCIIHDEAGNELTVSVNQDSITTCAFAVV